MQTAKEITQPEIMTMLQNTAYVVQTDDPIDTSLISIFCKMNNPAVCTGLVKPMQVLKSMADKP